MENLRQQISVGIPHADIVKEVMVVLEEEGVSCRIVKVYRTSDVSFIAHDAAELSGSGIGIWNSVQRNYCNPSERPSTAAKLVIPTVPTYTTLKHTEQSVKTLLSTLKENHQIRYL